jgi:Mce-associated membrane protein
VAINADPAERTVSGSIDVLTQPAEQISESAETTAGCDAYTNADDTAAADKEQASADADTQADADGRDKAAVRSGFRLALVLGLAGVAGLGGLAVWLGWCTHQAQQADQQRNRFLDAGKVGALNLTTINYTEAGADIQRILDSSTGQFYDDFSKRAPAFVDVVKQSQSKTQGSITEAGVESISGGSARVLVAVSVDTSNAGAAEQTPRHWRMRVDVQKVGDTMKVSNVGFVP